MLEIERKFLIDRDKLPESIIRNKNLLDIEQHYICISDGISVRVRKSLLDSLAEVTMTVKVGSGLSRTEIEVPIDLMDYGDLVRASIASIKKKRKLYKLDGYTISLDCYEQLPLVIAEVEFASEDEAISYNPPNWFGEEVTGNDYYTNANLAKEVTK